MTTTKIDQKEYLKRYLSGGKDDKDKKKKKKKKDKNGKSNVKIIDDDDYAHHHIASLQATGTDDASDLFALDDEAPQIVGIIDERPAELKAKEDFSTSKWKKLSADSSMGKEMDRSPPRKPRDSSPPSRGRGKHDSDSEQSPPRKREEKNSSPSRRHEKSKRRDSDASPPRKRQEKDSSAPRRQEKSSGRRDSDASPPRRRDRGRDESPPRRARKDYESDQSPPRRKRDARSRKDSDESPPRRSQKERGRRDSDESPPRRSQKERGRRDSYESPPRRSQKDRGRRDSDESPPRRRTAEQYRSRKQSDSDQSPPRRSGKEDSRRDRRRKDSDSDVSPTRRSQHKSDHGRAKVKQERGASPAPSRASVFSLSRVKQEPLDSDESPRRADQRRRSADSDQSPPRRIKRERDSPPPRVKREQRSPEAGPSSSPSRSRMTKTLDGKRAGLQDARALKKESEKFRQRENEAYDTMSAEVSGRYAKTVVREKHGKRKDVEEELRKEFEKRKRDEKKKEVYTRWGKGVKQVEDYKAKLEEAAHEMSKPLARYADDKDLDEHLKQQERLGDPMLEYIRSKKKEKDRQEGRPQKPLYKGSFPDNRFGIRPGYRWDGVDRSNGFEKKWFEMVSKKKAGEEEAYKYSVEDM